MKTSRLFILIGLCLACTSCARKKHSDPKLWEIKTPEARIIAMTIARQTDQGFRVEAVVELTNPNRVDLPLLDIHYRISIDGVGALNVIDKANRVIPAHGQQKIVLPASFAWSHPAPAGRPWHVAGKIQYQPPGELREIMTQTYIPLPVTYFQASGTLK